MQENLPEEEATKIRNKDYSNPTKATKCFRTCVFEKIGTLKDNKIQEAVVLEKFSPFFGEENVKKMVERCRGIKGEDRCVTGFQIYQCLENAKTELTMEA